MSKDINAEKNEVFEKIIEITNDLPADYTRDILIFSQGVKAAFQYRSEEEPKKESEAS